MSAREYAEVDFEALTQESDEWRWDHPDATSGSGDENEMYGRKTHMVTEQSEKWQVKDQSLEDTNQKP